MQREMREMGGQLPTFLGIGAPKAGSTWLYRLLDSHPDVLMSRDRKEIHYFDLHFDRGPLWYQRFFLPPGGVAPVATGEFTPHYLYRAEVPARVRSVPSVERFVLIVRNPVDRAYSHFRFRQRQDNQRQSFEEFLASDRDAIDWGRYGTHLARWLAEFDRDRFLVLRFEEAVKAADATKAALATHLGLAAAGFPAGPPGAANEAFAPRHRRLYAAGVRRARWLRAHDLDRVITLAKRSGAVGALKRARPDSGRDGPSPDQRRRLWDHFEDDSALLERLTGLDLHAWRP